MSRAELSSRHDPKPGNRRLDIQGLRAIAVLMVVLFHARLPVPGGFVGVDVFFVISGFVITALLRREWLETQGIRLRRFYTRRFLRLTPALALVSIWTVFFSTLLLPPAGAELAAKTALGAMLLAANWVIASMTGGYFDPAAETNTLLNTWSLSVEEQFYLFFPALLWVSWLLARRRRSLQYAPQLMVCVVGLFSFTAACVYPQDGTAGVSGFLFGFYGPLSRAWEFAIGALLALIGTKVSISSRWFATSVSIVGLSALLFSLGLIDGNTRFPGPWTLMPVFGTALLLLGGAHDRNPLNRFLSCRPLVKVGDWSYSIYLWHWPFIVLAGQLWPENEHIHLFAALASVAPAIASYYWLEQPLRQLHGLSAPRLTAVVAIVVGPAILVAALFPFVASSYWSWPIGSADAPVKYKGEINWNDHDYKYGGFHPCDSPALRKMVDDAPNYEPRCQQSMPGSNIGIALIGDSHAEHLFIGLSEALPDVNIMYFTDNGFPTMANPQFVAAIDYVNANPAITRVIVTAFWRGRQFQADELEVTLRTLLAHGKRVIMTDGVPFFPFSPARCKYPTSWSGVSTCSMNAKMFWSEHRLYFDKLSALVAKIPEVILLETAAYLCDPEKCSMAREESILYADPTHLNVLGSRFVGKQIVNDYAAQLRE